MFSMVLADVFKRWQTLRGRKALLCTGTDEHGMKVQRAAAQENYSPKAFCDMNARTFQELAREANIDNDFFIRTTDSDHIEAVKHFWHLLEAKGLIYESKHGGWYCVSDECFYPESQVGKTLDPMTGEVIQVVRDSGKKVEWIEEKNYHFRLTAMRDQLLDFYKQNPEWIVPAWTMHEAVRWVEFKLEDLSISRPAERLSWGVPVPNDPSQTIYVWVDALVNYITKAGFPNWAPGQEHQGGWPADVQVIGKDIARFHAVYWPALLLAVDIPPPKRILSHAHWTLGGKKMSKSIGNVVNPSFAMERWGVDTMRYFLVSNGGIADDSDYSNDAIAKKYLKNLQHGIGNLASRLTRPKGWKIHHIVAGAKALLPLGHLKHLEIYEDHVQLLESLPSQTANYMDALNAKFALRSIVDVMLSVCIGLCLQSSPAHVSNTDGLLSQTNQYLNKVEPWHLFKTKLNTAPSDGEWGKVLREFETSVYLATESLRICGILLQPFMPEKASQLLDMLGVDESRRTFDDARLGADFTYGEYTRKPGKGKFQGLFPPQPVED